MRDHEVILNLLADPNADEDEINARVWCYKNGITLLKVKRHKSVLKESPIHPKISHIRTKEFGDISHTFPFLNEPEKARKYGMIGRYTQSLDAIKALMDEHLKGWRITACYQRSDNGHVSVNLMQRKPDDLLNEKTSGGRYLPTIQRAWLYAVIEAIAYERERG